ncbi:MAG: hypothetical protein C0596_06285 [Marinilabiliales bacterium]|nr:MAG: hypothetical protein C0596_06285 [Marinilabiliales bacterium]
MITIKNYPLSDSNGATQNAETELNSLISKGYKIISSSTAKMTETNSTGKKFDFILLTVILEN